MKRLTNKLCKDDVLDAQKEPRLKSQAETWLRLCQLEDILGDTYDLDRLRKLVEADKDGRIAILSEPMKPMVYKPNDTDVYCPKCGNTLSGGWELSDADDGRKIVQCPKCGQAIDDTKCEPAAEAALAKEADHE